MLAIKKKIDNNSIYIEKFLEFNHEGIKEGEQKFNEYKQSKIILNTSFSDNVWTITNEVITKSFDFTVPQTLFESEKKKKRNLGSFKDFINVLKIYFVFELETTALGPIHLRFNAFKKVLLYTRYFSQSSTVDNVIKGRKRLNQFNLKLLQTCMDILNFYPVLIQVVYEKNM